MKQYTIGKKAASDIYTAHGIYGKSDFRRKKPAF